MRIELNLSEECERHLKRRQAKPKRPREDACSSRPLRLQPKLKRGEDEEAEPPI